MASCSCPERKKPIQERAWRVLTYLGNYSAFNGYHFTRSEYSSVACDACCATWRTKADYVQLLAFQNALGGGTTE